MRLKQRAMVCLAAAALALCSIPPASAAERMPVAVGNAVGIAAILNTPMRPIFAKVAASEWLPRRLGRCAHLGCPGYFIVGIAY